MARVLWSPNKYPFSPYITFLLVIFIARNNTKNTIFVLTFLQVHINYMDALNLMPICTIADLDI